MPLHFACTSLITVWLLIDNFKYICLKFVFEPALQYFGAALVSCSNVSIRLAGSSIAKTTG